MSIPFNAVQAASGLKNAEVASACGIAQVTYQQNRKKDPGTWKLEELKSYYGKVDDFAKPLLLQAVEDFICQ